ncbi:unnamed protein product [Rotaria sp. Silwood2]|nr:unnamed protein product [Rotaria sp. Silwood2]CAF2507544.1 unnamed protein product [Rotaria sp. Silwood2]CAF2899761.1 unnamed protein product [Rotaria sp. Silwood2]CAF3062761.1 unnamed protein product [Rotaria sp. Silwood2]CAF3952362.1 unnamed protein product [Rotaria sp. Silwood2]
MSAHHKRWTFNSWRLHGRRYTSQAPLLNPTIEPFSFTISPDVNHQDQLLDVDNDDDDDTYKRLLHQLQLFQKLELKQKEDNGNNEF